MYIQPATTLATDRPQSFVVLRGTSRCLALISCRTSLAITPAPAVVSTFMPGTSGQEPRQVPAEHPRAVVPRADGIPNPTEKSVRTRIGRARFAQKPWWSRRDPVEEAAGS